MDRKEMVKVLEKHLGVKSKYLAAPSFAYQIETADETYTIDRKGKITTAKGKELKLEEIINAAHSLQEESSEINEVEVVIQTEGHTGITLRNLTNMIFSKQALIKKAFEITEDIVEEKFAADINAATIISIEDFKTALQEIGESSCPGIKFNFDDNTITFKFLKGKWSVEKVQTYSDFVAILNKNAKALKYASAKPSSTDNEKYTFRTWLLRLGMIGDEYKESRKVLLNNLSGNGAFRKEKPQKDDDII